MFAERGFDEVTIDEIAAAVGVSKSTFFRHVPTKEALVIDPLVEGISGVVALFEARPSTESVRDALTYAAIECTREVSTAQLSVWSQALRTAPHLVTRISLVSDSDRERLIELATSRLNANGPDNADHRHAGLVVTIMLAAASYAFQCWIIDNGKGRESLEEQLQTALRSVSVLP